MSSQTIGIFSLFLFLSLILPTNAIKNLKLGTYCWMNESVHCSLSISPEIGDLPDRIMLLDSITDLSLMTSCQKFGLDCDYYRFCYWSNEEESQELTYQETVLDAREAQYNQILLQLEDDDDEAYVKDVKMFEVLDLGDINSPQSIGQAEGNILGMGFGQGFFYQALQPKNLPEIVTLFTNPVTLPQDFSESFLTLGGFDTEFLNDSEKEDFHYFDQNLDLFGPAPTVPISRIQMNGEDVKVDESLEHLQISTMDYGIYVPESVYSEFNEMFNEMRCASKGGGVDCKSSPKDYPTFTFTLGPDNEGEFYTLDIPFDFYTDQEEFSPMFSGSGGSWWENEEVFTIGLGPLSKLLVSFDYKNNTLGIATSKGAAYQFDVPSRKMVWMFLGMMLGLPVVVALLYLGYAAVVTRCFTKRPENDSFIVDLIKSAGNSRKNTLENQDKAGLTAKLKENESI